VDTKREQFYQSMCSAFRKNSGPNFQLKTDEKLKLELKTLILLKRWRKSIILCVTFAIVIFF